jgi:simple sugar transport system ATP-binding protein
MSGIAVSPALELRKISKRFGRVAANRNIDLTLERGSIHGIVGENGAGKSTLMSIIYGLVRPDDGEIAIDGAPVTIRNVRDARRCGIGMVHQHFMLIDTMSVLDNILLGDGDSLFLRPSRRRLRQRLLQVSHGFGVPIAPDTRVGNLPVGARQRVEILKALVRGARILILDEPTAVLTPEETQELFQLVRRLRDDGCSILFVSHKLAEIKSLTDQVSVLRQGEMVLQVRTQDIEVDALAEIMIGQHLSWNMQREARAPGEAVLRAEHLQMRARPGSAGLRDVSLDVHAGEIVGVAGVAGNGQSDLLEGLSGLRPLDGGRVFVSGKRIRRPDIHPNLMRARGVSLVPEERMRHGLVADMPACESVMLGRENHPRYGVLWLEPDAIFAACRRMMQRWDIRPDDPEHPTRLFSGGNQQKLVLARELAVQPKLLLIGQPTRGVDIGSVLTIHERLLALREAGQAVLLVSSDLDEILALSDRILVMQGGRIVGERRPHETSARDLGLLMGDVRERAP